MEFYRCRLSLQVIEAERSSSWASEPRNTSAMVEAIPDGRQPEGVTLPGQLEGMPVGWGEQTGDKSSP
jgi:hypothetical protein